MKIGTFWCWLFGHKFLCEGVKQVDYVPSGYVTLKIQTDFCYRCGVDTKSVDNPIVDK